MEMVFEDYYPKGSEDHTPILTAALAKKPDVIQLGAGAPEEMSMIIKEARELGYTGWFITGGGFSIDRLNEIAGKDFAYNILHTSFDINNPPEPYIPDDPRPAHPFPNNGTPQAFPSSVRARFKTGSRDNKTRFIYIILGGKSR